MSGGQDPGQMDWEISTGGSADYYRRPVCPLFDIAKDYLQALDESRMSDVYRLREKLRMTKPICDCGEPRACQR